MRVTSQTLQTRALNDLALTQSRIAATQAQISSGKQIAKPSDDAIATRDALRTRAEVEQLDGFKSAADAATDWTQATDTALGQVTDSIHRVRELLVKAASSTTSTADRRTIAREVAQLTEGVKDSINARQGDQNLFGGTKTTTAPYAPGSDTYTGDAGVVARTIGPGVAVQVNVLGSAVLGSGQAAGDGLLLNTLRDIGDHLNADDVASLGTTDLQALARNLDTLTSVRATTGATQSRIEAAGERLVEAKGVAADRLSTIEGTDYAKAILDLNAQSTAYQAALKSSAQIIQPSLLDFLR